MSNTDLITRIIKLLLIRMTTTNYTNYKLGLNTCAYTYVD